MGVTGGQSQSGSARGSRARGGLTSSPGFAFSEASLHLVTNCTLWLSFWHVSGMW